MEAPMKINDVFKPRSAQVDKKTYIPRADLEQALLRSVQGSMHSILFGESGNGKTWLYKKVFEQHGYQYRVTNCASASRFGSLTQAIKDTLLPTGHSNKTRYTENKEAMVKVVIAEGKITNQSQYDVHQSDPLLEAFLKYRVQVGSDDAVLVIDNLESIFENTELMDELADIVILLDDERFAACKIKLLIVGTPNGILEYFTKTKNLESVSNRLNEVQKVEGMNLSMVETLVERGFNNLLKFEISNDSVKYIATHVFHCTLGIAQRVQEYCEKLAYEISDNRNIFDDKLLKNADKNWLKIGLRQSYSLIEYHLNSNRTTIARRNQVIYCVGLMKTHQLDSTKISEKIRKEFPDTAKSSGMGIGTILRELAEPDQPLLKKNAHTNDYRVADPRYMMCIRTMLRKDTRGRLVKLDFGV